MTTSQETTTKLPKKNKPNFYVYATVPYEDKSKVGASIGRVFNHKTGGGFTIYLDAVPIPNEGQVELVAYIPKP